eukprot:gnl/MRDRNA2_/MRDRNA2_66890_c0_seq2.p1 gnl/MRDRNA2_/MRDRNA2_66890_c0~~gnl/MRDRNA2_/MRDRNA2_66890_c0_seq2.p1  ORF type:complete len:109 (+),score=18.08 gnl/MRDRNA2_/MRDRNA2_66890_c0_seq2:214-540(+)
MRSSIMVILLAGAQGKGWLRPLPCGYTKPKSWITRRPLGKAVLTHMANSKGLRNRLTLEEIEKYGPKFTTTEESATSTTATTTALRKQHPKQTTIDDARRRRLKWTYW